MARKMAQDDQLKLVASVCCACAPGRAIIEQRRLGPQWRERWQLSIGSCLMEGKMRKALRALVGHSQFSTHRVGFQLLRCAHNALRAMETEKTLQGKGCSSRNNTSARSCSLLQHSSGWFSVNARKLHLVLFLVQVPDCLVQVDSAIQCTSGHSNGWPLNGNVSIVVPLIATLTWWNDVFAQMMPIWASMHSYSNSFLLLLESVIDGNCTVH